MSQHQAVASSSRRKSMTRLAGLGVAGFLLLGASGCAVYADPWGPYYHPYNASVVTVGPNYYNTKPVRHYGYVGAGTVVTHPGHVVYRPTYPARRPVPVPIRTATRPGTTITGVPYSRNVW